MTDGPAAPVINTAISNTRAIHQRLWSLAWPLILAHITIPLLGLVDTAVLGHLEKSVYLAAVAIGAMLFNLLFWSFGFLRMSTTSHAARTSYHQTPEQSVAILGQSLLIALILGITIVLSRGPLGDWGLYLLGSHGEVAGHASAYFDIRIYSAPATLASFVIIGWLVGNQQTKGPLFILVLTNLTNLILDIVFVVVLDFRSDGVAWATLIAEYVALIAGFLWLQLKFPNWNRYFAWHRVLNTQSVREIFRTNTDLFVRTFCILAVLAFFTRQGALQGDIILAANAILLTFLILLSNGLDGFANATEALIGERISRRDATGFSRVSQVAAIWGGVSAALFFIGYLVFGELLISLLTDIESVRTEAIRYIGWLCLMPLVASPGFMLDGIFVGSGKTREMRDSMAMSVVMVFLPVWFLSRAWENDGLWLSLCFFMAFRSLSLACYFKRYQKQQRWFAP